MSIRGEFHKLKCIKKGRKSLPAPLVLITPKASSRTHKPILMYSR